MSEGPSTPKPSFLRSTFILASANFATKVIGGLIIVPVYYLIGSKGMGLYTSAYRIYMVLLIISTQGVNIAVARLVAERMAVDDKPGARRVFAVAYWLLVSLGLAFALFFGFGSHLLIRLFSIDPRSYLSMLALAPAVFLVAVMSVYRGFLQGLQWMTPFAVSQFIEQIARLVGIFVALHFVAGLGVEYGAAAATFGAVIGALFALGYLIYESRVVNVRFRLRPEVGLRPVAKRHETRLILRSIISVAVPVTFSGVATQVIQFLDVALVQGRLRAAGFAADEVISMFARLSGAAMTLVNLPTIFAGAFFLALIPAISEARQLRRRAVIRHRVAQSLHLTLALTIPAAVGLLVLPSQIAATLFDDPVAGTAVSALALTTVFLSLQQTTSGILYGLGRSTTPIYNLLLGGAVKAVLTWFLAGMPGLNVRGAAYATVIGFFVAAGLNWLSVERLVPHSLDWRQSLLKPAVASLVMAPVARYSYQLLRELVGHAKVATILAVGVAAAVYFVVLTALGGLDEEVFARVPIIGRRVAAVLRPLQGVRERLKGGRA